MSQTAGVPPGKKKQCAWNCQACYTALVEVYLLEKCLKPFCEWPVIFTRSPVGGHVEINKKVSIKLHVSLPENKLPTSTYTTYNNILKGDFNIREPKPQPLEWKVTSISGSKTKTTTPTNFVEAEKTIPSWLFFGKKIHPRKTGASESSFPAGGLDRWLRWLGEVLR